MSTENEESKQVNDMSLPKEQTSECGSGCACHNTGLSGRMRWIIGVVIILAALVLVVRAVIKGKSDSNQKKGALFADVANPAQVAVSLGTEIKALAELNSVAAAQDAVFIILARKGDSTASSMTAVQSAVRTLGMRGIKIGVYILSPESADYERVSIQVQAPAVLAMVKRRGMNAVSGEITETKLVQGFVSASNVGCGPSGCGPSGCGPSGCGPSTPGCD